MRVTLASVESDCGCFWSNLGKVRATPASLRCLDLGSSIPIQSSIEDSLQNEWPELIKNLKDF